MYDLLIRTLSTFEQWLMGESSHSEQAQRLVEPVPAYVKALQYDHYIRANVKSNEQR